MSTSNIKDEEAIKANVMAYAETWNISDAEKLAALFSEDADFVTVMGMWFKGREEIKGNHAWIFSTLMRRSRLSITCNKIRFLKPDTAVAHGTWELVGQLGPDGEKLPPKQGVLSTVMTRLNDRWQIVVAQNTYTVSMRADPKS